MRMVSAISMGLIAMPAMACPPSFPLLSGVPAAKQTPEWSDDSLVANTAQSKLWAMCYEHAANDCQAQCDAAMLDKYRYQESDIHYQYSPEERKDAHSLIDSLQHKWNAK